MKRTGALSRGSKPLSRRSRLRARPRSRQPRTAAEDAWKTARAGFCECGCDRFSIHLERHHVVERQTVHREGGDEWALSNSMLLHPHCHANHTSAFRRISLPMVPQPALDFAVRLLGFDRAAIYMARMYQVELHPGDHGWRP